MIRSILNERISDVIYHTTSLERAISVVSTDEFRLMPVFKTSSEFRLGNNKLFYLSTTRSKLGIYTANYAAKGTVVMNLDGRKLNYRYHGKAVDYWGPSFRKDNPANNEMEDRIFSDYPTIPNATSYIKEMHILIDNTISADMFHKLVYLKKQPIPIYVYAHRKSFILQNKANAVKKLQTLNIEDPSPSTEQEFHTKSLAHYKSIERHNSQRSPYNNIFRGLTTWVILMTAPISDYHKLHYKLRDYIHTAIAGDGSIYYADLKNKLSSDLGRRDVLMNQHSIKIIANMMRNNKLKSPSDIIDFIAKRWKSEAT